MVRRTLRGGGTSRRPLPPTPDGPPTETGALPPRPQPNRPTVATRPLPPTPPKQTNEARNNPPQTTADQGSTSPPVRTPLRAQANQNREAANRQNQQAEIPPAFNKNPKSSIAFLTQAKLTQLLPSYLSFLTQPARADAIRRVLAKWPDFMREQNKFYNTIPHLIQEALGEDMAAKALNHVKTINAQAAPAPANGGSVLYRGDTRSPQQIEDDGGLHGRGGSMSLEHARAWVGDVWNNMSAAQKRSWLQDWKVETSSRTDAMPFVATGWESQKPGQEYRASLPFLIPNPTVTPVVAHNGDTLENASIIVVTGRNEVVFLTGIPNKYINHVAN